MNMCVIEALEVNAVYLSIPPGVPDAQPFSSFGQDRQGSTFAEYAITAQQLCRLF